MNNKEVAKTLEEIGRMLALKDENPFKVRSYEDAARTIDSISTDVDALVEDDELTDLDGIGEGLAKKIRELVRTGSLEYYENLREDIPEGILRMLDIPGLGPKKVQALWEEGGYTTMDALEEAAENQRVRELDGFGATTEENILDGIEHIRSYRQRFLISEALDAARPYLDLIRNHDRVRRAEPCGSLRRRCETVGDVDLLASVPESDRESVMDDFVNLDETREVIAHGSTKSSVRTRNGVQVDLRLVDDEQYPFALHYFTGSKEHNVKMRSRAIDRDLKLNEYGLFRDTGDGEDGERLDCDTEKELFDTLDLHYIPPELREDMGEIEHATEQPPPDLIERSDLRGTFHVHTTRSDGRAPLRAMVEACVERGFEYVGISDHSESAQYAGGLTSSELRDQRAEIADLNDEFEEISIFSGIESDIHPDGSLDYDDDLLDELDFVIASVHQQFQLDEDEQTRRLVRAVEHEHTTMLGHPTGRRLLTREGYDVDLEPVIEAAARTDTIIEINANPERLDLDWRMGPLAREHDLTTSINPDAHSRTGLDHVRWGVGIARKSWWTPDRVLNSWPVDRVRSFLNS